MSEVNIEALSNCVVLSENNDSVLMQTLWQKQTIILIFLRHFGCIFCRQHAKQVWSEREKYEKNGARIVFIGNGAPYMIHTFKEELEIMAAPIFTDPALKAFNAVGFKRGFLASMGPQVIVNAVKALAEGHSQGGMYKKDQGDLWQLGGLVVIKPNGQVSYVFISEVAGEFSPELDETLLG